MANVSTIIMGLIYAFISCCLLRVLLHSEDLDALVLLRDEGTVFATELSAKRAGSGANHRQASDRETKNIAFFH